MRLNSLPILYYHRVGPFRKGFPRKLCVTSDQFLAQMLFLRRCGCVAVTPDDIERIALKGVTLPPRSVAITFDDGYQGIYQYALPILARLELRATVYLIAGKTGETHRMMEEPGFLPERLMTWREAREMASSGIVIGSHTLTHAALDRLSPEEARREVVGSKRLLEENLGFSIRHFSYPKGHWNRTLEEMVRSAGYATACATRGGEAPSRETLFRIRRTPISANDTLWDFARKALLRPIFASR